MRSSLECLQEFIDKNGEEWQKRLSTCMKSDEELSPDERACFQDFVEAYREARAKKWKYMDAKRAGWVEPGKRTRENHAILVPRREAVAMADELATAVFAKEIYLTWMMNLQGFMVQLAAGEHDAVTCPECSRVFRAGWMNGRCPYCEAEQNATKYVCGLREAAGK